MVRWAEKPLKETIVLVKGNVKQVQKLLVLAQVSERRRHLAFDSLKRFRTPLETNIPYGTTPGTVLFHPSEQDLKSTS
jgi:hypothetical protein